MTSTQNITVHVHNYGTIDPESIAASVASAIAPVPEPFAPRIVPTFTDRMDNSDRRALWAAFTEAFGDVSRTERLTFTRTILGLPNDVSPSWSSQGTLTSDQVQYMIRVLRVIAALL